jgi:Protein of unknown function (DUF4238)
VKKRELRAQRKLLKQQKHHYIPQFYLRPWLGVDHKLEEFGRVPPSDQIRSRRRGTDSTGFEYNLYTIPGVTEKSEQNIERIFMATVDNTAAAARDELLRGIIPTGSLRQAWARFILSLAIRTPNEIRSLKERFIADWMKPDADIQSRYETEKKPDWPETLEEYLLKQEPTVSARQAMITATQVIQHERVTQLLMNSMWWILDTSSVRQTLMTSDHPLVMTNGLVRPDGHFAMPIGPHTLFVAFMHQEFSKRFRREPLGRVVRLTNEAVVGQGRKYVYGLDGSNIAYVRRMMGKREYVKLIPETKNKREADV